MTAAPDIGALLGALRGLVSEPGLPPRAAATAEALLARFERPVRVTLLGLPGAGQLHLANALLGDRVIAPDPRWPTTELVFGEAAAFTATLADGSTMRGKGRPDLDRLPEPVAFLRIAAPLRPLQDMSVLAVMPTGTRADLCAALDWAARRTDVTLWCSTTWSVPEAELWAEAPDLLRNHAFLAFTAPDPTVPDTAGAFEDAFALGAAGGLDRLLGALWTVISEARRADADAARLVLRQYGATCAPEPEADGPARPMPVAQPGVETPAPRPVPEAARAVLTRGFGFLRRQARGMLAALEDGTDDHDLFLRDIEAAIGTLTDILGAEDEVRDTWPGLVATLDEAAEVALLLRYEGGADQAADAAALLLQLRHEMEGELAA